MDFENCKALKRVVLASGITKIPDYCFRNCSSLSEINLSGVSTIGRGAFEDCRSLGGMITLNSITCINDRAFNGCSSINDVEINLPSPELLIGIPGGITGVMSEAFAGSRLSNVTLPDSLKLICDNAFGKSDIESVVIPKSVHYLESGYSGDVFYNCSKLTRIDVIKGNPVYSSFDGVLYREDDDGCYLECYPSARKGSTYTVREDCAIDTGAFTACKYLKKVNVPDSVVNRRAYELFRGCKGIEVNVNKAGGDWSCNAVFDEECKGCSIKS